MAPSAPVAGGPVSAKRAYAPLLRQAGQLAVSPRGAAPCSVERAAAAVASQHCDVSAAEGVSNLIRDLFSAAASPGEERSASDFLDSLDSRSKLGRLDPGEVAFLHQLRQAVLNGDATPVSESAPEPRAASPCASPSPRSVRRGRSADVAPVSAAEAYADARGLSPRMQRPAQGRNGERHVTEQRYLQRLRQAHAEAMESGDQHAADAVIDALHAEGLSLEEERHGDTDGAAAGVTEHQGTGMLGSMCCLIAKTRHPQLLSAAEAAKRERRRAGGVARCANPCVRSDGDAELELPQGELSSRSSAAIGAWAWGHISGHRCLFEVLASTPMSGRSDAPQTAGQASWRTLALMCGLASGEQFFAAGGIRTDVFKRHPSAVAQEAWDTVRAEADIPGRITMEELHLSLRSFEIKARSNDTGDEGLTVQVWRELFRAHCEGPHERASSAIGGPAQALTSAMRLGAEGVEREARRQTLDELRAEPVDWQVSRGILVRMLRCINEEIHLIEMYGPYAVVGVSVDATDADLKRAYRDACLRHHPDKGGSTAVFQSLQQAHARIVDDRKRGFRPPKIQEPAQPAPAQGAPDSPEPQQSPPRQQSGPAQRHAASRRSSRPTAPTGSPNATAYSGSGNVGFEDSHQEDFRAAEAFRMLESMYERAHEAAERVAAAAQAYDASLSVLEPIDANDCDPEDRECIGDAGRILHSVLQTCAEASSEAVHTAADAAQRVVAAAVLGMAGDAADSVLEASAQCSTCSNSATETFAWIRSMCDELGSALERAIASSDASDVSQDVLQQFFAVAVRGRDAVREAERTVLGAANAVKQACAAASGVGAPRANGCSRQPDDHLRRPPRASSAENFRTSASRPPSAVSSAGSCHGRGRPPASPASPPIPQQTGGIDGAAEAASHRPTPPPIPPQTQRQPSPRWRRATASSSVGGATPCAADGCTDDPHQSPPTRARSGSAGARGRVEALVRRRLELFEDLQKLNTEVRGLQRRLHEALLRNPLLLPLPGPAQRARIFAVAAECLQDEVAELRRTGTAEVILSSSALHGLVEVDAGSSAEVALRDARSGAVHMAALVDCESMAALLEGEYLEAAIKACPQEEQALRKFVGKATKALTSWVQAKVA